MAQLSPWNSGGWGQQLRSPAGWTVDSFTAVSCTETFEGENFCELVKNTIFMEETHGLLAFAALKDTMLPNFKEKSFANSHKTVKFVEVFSLESFPLYSIV